MKNTKAISQRFETYFGHLPSLVVRAPGRINLIGEHTDYNEGFVLPAAIDKEIQLAIAANQSNKIRLYSIDFEDFIEVDLNTLVPLKSCPWANYLIGVSAQFVQKGLIISGFDCAFGGNIPAGAGLSSSAAVCCAMALAINELYQFHLPILSLAKFAQQSEHDFSGVRCGLMDQVASLLGRENQVIRLDCQSLDYQYFPINSHDFSWVLIDSQVKHSLASSEYNNRRAECEKGVEILQKHLPNLKSLRDANQEVLTKYASDFEKVIWRRCHYVVSENQRVLDACYALEKDDFEGLGKLLNTSHSGLSLEYEVSCPELDFLAAFAQKTAGVLGARMMGGGFGGCTLNLVRNDCLDDFVRKITFAYQEKFDISSKNYSVNICNGASRY